MHVFDNNIKLIFDINRFIANYISQNPNIIISANQRGTAMEPIARIVGALVAGASPDVKDTAGQAVKDAYQGLRAIIMHHWKNSKTMDTQDNESEAKFLLENFDEDPETYKAPLEKKLAKIMPEPEKGIVELAQQLYKLTDEAGYKQGKYNVVVNDGKGVQIGDNNTQINKF